MAHGTNAHTYNIEHNNFRAEPSIYKNRFYTGGGWINARGFVIGHREELQLNGYRLTLHKDRDTRLYTVLLLGYTRRYKPSTGSRA